MFAPRCARLSRSNVGGAHAQAAGAGASPFDVSWSALDPGDDWSWQMLKSVFPVTGAPPTNTGTAATLIGTLLGQITGLVMAIAAIMMFPLASGFSLGQAGVMQVAGWGIGMARSLYANAVKAIGPDAMVIANPIIPGTRTIVLGLIEDELCRSLINQATDATIVPAPAATVVNAGKGTVVTYAYSLAPGNGTGSPACGTVSVADSSAPATLGGAVDMASEQRSILEGIVASMRPHIDAIAQSYWQTKTQSALTPLLGLYQSTTQTYTQELTQAAEAITANLRASLNSTDARSGDLGLTNGEVKLSSLGWTSAAAYYPEFARLNGLTLSLASGTPTINTPTFEGLSPSLKADIAPLFTSSSSFLDKLKTMSPPPTASLPPAATTTP